MDKRRGRSFEETLSDRGDVCAFSGAREISAILENVGCNHIKTMAHVEAAFSADVTKDPSAEATLMGGKFYNDVWENGGREMAHEIMKKSEKDIDEARAEAKRAEEAVEREKTHRYCFAASNFGICFCGFGLIKKSSL
jgi:hypothetical protein